MSSRVTGDPAVAAGPALHNAGPWSQLMEHGLSPESGSGFDAQAEAASRLRPLGSSQRGLRQYNERVVLQAIRLHGPQPSAELARRTHLSAQAISMITKRLIQDGLLLKGRPQRGKVGQPSVPLALNPEGAYAIGVKLGRRSLDVLLVDFIGQVRQRATIGYAFPEPEAVQDLLGREVERLLAGLEPAGRERVVGIGLAAPLHLDGWQGLLGFPVEWAERWRQADLAAALEVRTGLPVDSLKDTAAACVAELVAGQGRSVRSFLYLFVATFIGGGLVIDSQLRAGLHGNAGAVGSLPLGCISSGPSGQVPPQLLSVASLSVLEERFAQAGLAPDAARDERALQDHWAPITTAWLAEAAGAMALAVNSAACLLDLDGVIVDGSFGRPLLQHLLRALQQAMDRYNWEGVARPPLLAGHCGADARALGGAWLPLHAHFAPDRDLFLKVAAPPGGRGSGPPLVG